MAKTLYLIDGHAQVYRAFYAIPGLTAPDGRPTNAAYGFIRMLHDLIGRHDPAYLGAVFDAPGKTFRHERYEAYKATRKPAPPELREQIPMIQSILEAYRIPVLSREGYEADDLLGTLSRRGAEAGFDVVLVTGDKDCGQLLREGVRLYDPMKDRTIDAAAFREEKGIAPDRLPDLMGLVGDTSDNIPGVPKIGPKTGAQLIAKYGDLETLLEKADEIKGKRGELLREHAGTARLSKELATIDTDAPVPFEPERFLREDPDYTRLESMFRDLGFHSLLAERGRNDSDNPGEERDYRIVSDTGAFAEFLEAWRSVPRFALDTEATALDPMRAELVGVSLSWAEREAYYLPFRAPEGEPVLGAEALAALKERLEDPEVRLFGQNLKYDALVLRRAGIELKGIDFDTLLASNLVDGHLVDHGLDTLARRHLGLNKIPTKELLGSGKKQITMDAVPLERIGEYACEDADVTFRLGGLLTRRLDEEGGRELLETLELPLSFVLTEMQAAGIRVDVEKLRTMSRECETILEATVAEIHHLAGREFNVASPKQLGGILFEEMGIPVVRRTKTGPSTDEAVLTELAAQGHELPERVLEYRSYSKLKNTYLDALPAMVNPHTGRIHTTFSQTSTATGRLASHDPNLQNIPVRTAYGRTIRAAFVPEPGWRMLAADYSQVELRMLAHLSGDARLRAAFEEGSDIHRAVAAEVHGLDEDEVTDEQRSAAKAVNFGIIYGQTAHGLARTTGMTRGQAQLFIDSYFEQFPRVRDFIDDTIAAAHDAGGVTTLLGRRRQIPELGSANKAKCARAEREAVNTVVQGSAADLIKTAMVRLHARMRAEGVRARMLLQIHDELVLETPPEEADRLAAAVREEMESALPLEVPLVVDLGFGDNWLEAK